MFSEDGTLCDSHGVLSFFGDETTPALLTERFLRSLYGDREDFVSFCKNDGSDPVRVYRLRCFTARGELGFAFCEKNTLDGCTVTAVHLASNPALFYPLMSPHPSVIDTYPAELYRMKYASLSGGATQLSAETFSAVERTPYLAEALLAKNASAGFTDVYLLTESVLKQLCGTYSGTKIEFPSAAGKDGSMVQNGIVGFAPEAYTALLTLLSSIEASLSSSHRITIGISPYHGAADVTLTTVTDCRCASTPLAGINYLRHFGVNESLIHISGTVADISGTELTLSYERKSGVLSVTVGLGYDLPPKPDFKFRDPLALTDTIVGEALILADC